MVPRRMIGSHWYEFDTQHHNKVRAYARAQKLRATGYHARVIKTDALTWEVYYRE